MKLCRSDCFWLFHMTSNDLEIRKETIERIIRFRDERNWIQFHNLKDLAISISLEASELLECFQWSGSDTEVASKHKEMKEELSDVIIYAILLADRLNIDLDAAIKEKIAQNAKKYPVEKSYGKASKYTEI